MPFTRIKPVFFLFFVFSCLTAKTQDDSRFTEKDFSIELPALIVTDIDMSGKILCSDIKKLRNREFVVSAVINGERKQIQFDEFGEADFSFSADRKEPISLKIDGFTYVKVVEPMPLWLSIFPPLLVIALALVLKEGVSSLLIGIFSGAILFSYYSIDSDGALSGMLRAIDHYFVQAMMDEGHVSVILFSTIIGGIVAVIKRYWFSCKNHIKGSK